MRLTSQVDARLQLERGASFRSHIMEPHITRALHKEMVTHTGALQKPIQLRHGDTIHMETVLATRNAPITRKVIDGNVDNFSVLSSWGKVAS